MLRSNERASCKNAATNLHTISIMRLIRLLVCYQCRNAREFQQQNLWAGRQTKGSNGKYEYVYYHYDGISLSTEPVVPGPVPVV